MGSEDDRDDQQDMTNHINKPDSVFARSYQYI